MLQALAGPKDVFDAFVRRRQLDSEKHVVRVPEPPRDFSTHVHLNERELFQVLCVEPIEVRRRNLDRGAVFDSTDGGTARTVVD